MIWWNHSTPVSLTDSKVYQFPAEIQTLLESCFVASFPNGVCPIFVNEIGSSITLESEYELWTFEFLLNCPICFLVVSVSFCKLILLSGHVLNPDLAHILE